jgi:ribonuclease HI
MGKIKFYAVVRGRKPGIYTEWFGSRGAEVQIKGFAGAVYKSFSSKGEAEAWALERSAGTAAREQTIPLFPADKEAAREKAPKRIREDPPAPLDPAGGAVIYSDGGCSKNPGPGGYGVVLLNGGVRKELSGGFARTTNNRMELTACIKGLEALEQKCPVVVYSDSQYVVNGITKGWARRWKSNNWMRTGDEPAENSDLWSRLLELCDEHEVRFQWVRGHNGNRENERCDTLAVEMTRQGDLPPDHGYKGAAAR